MLACISAKLGSVAPPRGCVGRARVVARLFLLSVLGSSALIEGCGWVGLELKPSADAGSSLEPDADGMGAVVREAGADCEQDDDEDGVCNLRDNCPMRANPDQYDRDEDELGDACDSDIDGDGSSNEQDECPLSAPDDSDDDGVCDDHDECLPGDDRLDEDDDGEPDACDRCPGSVSGDSDHDAICDDADACPGSDDRVDSDADGTPDGCDACPREPSKTQADACGCARTVAALAHWPLDEASGSLANDVQGAHSGRLVNFPGTPWHAGHLANALSFDGIDDHVRVGALSSNARSLAFWMKAGAVELSRAETPWFSPSANGDRARQWFSPESVYASDDEYTNAGLGLIEDNAHDWYGFHIAVPSAATIDGITAQVEFNNTNPTCTFGIELSWNAGAFNTYTNTGFASLPLGWNDYLTFGAANEDWGHSWTPAQLGDLLFRVRLTKGGIPGSPMTPGVDHIRVKIHYAVASHLAQNVFTLGGGVQVQLSSQGIAVPGWPAGTRVFVDAAATKPLDFEWHHVVISSPTDVPFSSFQIGGATEEPGFFVGALDDVRVFTETLGLEHASAVMANGECGR